MHKYQDLNVPPGMAIQMFQGGFYKILYAAKDVVKLRDWAAELVNSLTLEAKQYLEAEKSQKKREQLQREKKIKMIANPNATPELDDHLDRMNAHVPIEKMSPVSLTEPLPPRKLNTNQGLMEVAGDVSDADLELLGIQILPMPEEQQTDTPTVQ